MMKKVKMRNVEKCEPFSGQIERAQRMPSFGVDIILGQETLDMVSTEDGAMAQFESRIGQARMERFGQDTMSQMDVSVQ